ncbi:MAG: Hsp20/alpha crystallin family protein [Ginsengibacter sp.]
MNSLIRRNNDVSYDPFVDFYNMESFFPAFSGSKSFPSVNISEDDKNYCVDVVAPGFNKDDFKINVQNDMLTISAEAKSEWSDNNEGNWDKSEGNEKQQKEKASQSGSKKESMSSSDEQNGNGNFDRNRQYSRREYSYSSFTRTFRLPENTNDDSISANYKNGILKLMIPKSEPEEKATKQITVS